MTQTGTGHRPPRGRQSLGHAPCRLKKSATDGRTGNAGARPWLCNFSGDYLSRNDWPGGATSRNCCSRPSPSSPWYRSCRTNCNHCRRGRNSTSCRPGNSRSSNSRYSRNWSSRHSRTSSSHSRHNSRSYYSHNCYSRSRRNSRSRSHSHGSPSTHQRPGPQGPTTSTRSATSITFSSLASP